MNRNQSKKEITVLARQVAEANQLTGPIRTLAALSDRFRLVEQIGFACNPFSPSVIPEGYEVTEHVVFISTNPQDREVYKGFFCKEGEVALTKVGLLKILGAMGATLINPADPQSKPYSFRTDDRRNPLYCSWSACLWVRDLTLKWVAFPGSKEIDLRDKRVIGGEFIEMGAERKQLVRQAAKYAAGDARSFTGPRKFERKFEELLGQAQQNIESLAETKAILRALRSVAGIRPAYLIEELNRKPFYAHGLRFVPDMSDKRVRLLVTAAEYGVVEQLFGGQPTKPGMNFDAPVRRPGLTPVSKVVEVKPVVARTARKKAAKPTSFSIASSAAGS
ncbi:MAG TPA: hypothetical protein VEZ90_12505 [Blastocatellia bacterium]|nr:hypothetical protein [Blastocatellia bacterium]